MFDKYFPQPSNAKFNIISPSNHLMNNHDMNVIPEEDEKSIYNITGKKNFAFSDPNAKEKSNSEVSKLAKKNELKSSKPIKFAVSNDKRTEVFFRVY